MSYNSKYKGSEVDAALDLAMTALQEEDKADLATKDDVTITEVAEVSNGVYAVTADGELIDYNIADSSCIGVALVQGEHKFMIAKSDATDGRNYTLYWGKNLYGKDVAGITNISSGADYIGEGKKYGTDFTTWSTGPVVDFNGAANTAAIIAGYTEHGVSMETRDMCSVLNTFNASDNFKDWYVPACGQLALMYLNITEINAALAKIGGTALAAEYYWSSSESSSGGAWRVSFGSGGVGGSDKGSYYTRVRFVRDISTEKKTPLKDYTLGLNDKIEVKQDKIPVKSYGTSSTTLSIAPNVLHKWGTVSTLTITLTAPTDTSVYNEYMIQFSSGSTPTTLSVPSTVKWVSEPMIEANKTYQISIVDNIGLIIGV